MLWISPCQKLRQAADFRDFIKFKRSKRNIVFNNSSTTSGSFQCYTSPGKTDSRNQCNAKMSPDLSMLKSYIRTTHYDLSLKVHGLHYHVSNVSNGDFILFPNCKVEWNIVILEIFLLKNFIREILVSKFL